MSMARRNPSSTFESIQSTAEDMAEKAQEAGAAAARNAAELKGGLAEEASRVAATVSDKLKSAGVDTDVMVSTAKNQAGELHKLLSAELRSRPLRTLGLAAVAGLIVGYLSAR